MIPRSEQNALVTGGAGFIGSHLVHALCGHGWNVTALDVQREYAWPCDRADILDHLALRQALLAGRDIARIDLVDTRRVVELLTRQQPDLVVHLAANPLVSAADSDPVSCRRDIVLSTESLLEAIRISGLSLRLVHVSSSMVYGDFDADRIDEAAATEPVNAYGRMKLEAEDLVRRHAALTGLETVIVRPMAVYGAGDIYRRVINNFCSQAASGRPIGLQADPATRIDFTHIEDATDFLIRAATAPAAAGETFNLSFGQARSLAEAVEILRSHFPGLRCENIPCEGPRRPQRGTLDIGKARQLLDYRPRFALEDGIALYLDFLRQKAA